MNKKWKWLPDDRKTSLALRLYYGLLGALFGILCGFLLIAGLGSGAGVAGGGDGTETALRIAIKLGCVSILFGAISGWLIAPWVDRNT